MRFARQRRLLLMSQNSVTPLRRRPNGGKINHMRCNELAAVLGGTINGPWINMRGPGHSPSDRSLGIKLDPMAPDGFRVSSLAGDDPDVCRQHVLALLKKVANGTTINIEPLTIGDDKAGHHAATALALWTEAQPAQGTLVETYLAARSCALSAVQADALRFHPFCPFGKRRFPAMVAQMRDTLTDEPKGILRVALADDGAGKRSMPDGMNARLMMGTAKGAAIKLQPFAKIMGIAEGIETALSASQLFKVPTWAVMSAGGIGQFPLVPGLEHLTIFADHDAAGLAAARKCAARYGAAGISGETRYPDRPGADWNCQLMGEQPCQSRLSARNPATSSRSRSRTSL
jgi:putative DNA primase/helicase